MSRNKNNSEIESNILFEGVNPELLQSFANPKNTIGKKEGAVIYQKGDLTEYIYLLIEGSVKLKYTEPDGTNIYISKSENSFFGETELLGKTQRKSSAVADTDCRMYTFNVSELKTLVKKDKQILKNLYNNKTFDFLEQDFIEATQDFLDPETDFADLIKTTTEKLAKKHTNSEGETLTDEKISTTEDRREPEDEQGVFDKIITKEEIEEDEIQTGSDSTENNIIEHKEIADNEENAFDKIITNEEIEEDEVQASNDLIENNIIEDKEITDNEENAFNKIITNEEVEETEEEAGVDISKDNIEEKIEESEEDAFDKTIIIEESEENNKQIESSKTEGSVQEDVPSENESFEEEQTKDKLEESEGFIIDDPSNIESVKPGETLKTFVLEEPEQESTTEINEEDNAKIVEPENFEADFSDYYESLLDATRNIFSKITIDETAEAIAESATKLINATGGVLYLVDNESEELKAKVLSENSIKDIRIKFSDGLQGTAIIEKRSIIVESPQDDKNFNPAIEDLTGIKIKNIIYYPVLTKSEEPVAVLELYNSERGKFDSREIELLNAISPSILKALSNAKYVDILVQQRKILALGEITGFINDDIKNSLLKVKHYSSLIKKKEPSPDVDKLLDLQIGQINSVEDFLKFTDAYSHGKNIAKQNTIKVSEAVTQVLNFLAEYADSRNTVIYKKIEEDAVINIDLPSMYFVCYQIAKNACDAMNEEGKIFVTSERDGDYIKIKFRDTGPGISETIKDKLFKPFVSYGKKQRPGLGLAIAEKIVSDQGGYIMTESVLGEGATFIIALPIVF